MQDLPVRALQWPDALSFCTDGDFAGFGLVELVLPAKPKPLATPSAKPAISGLMTVAGDSYRACHGTDA